MIKYKRIFVGSRCDNRCLYCHEKDGSSHLELSDIVSQLARNNGLDSVELCGGEPTLRTDFYNILDAARHQGFRRIKIVTNARTLADINAAVKTIESGCHFFEIKVHHYEPGIHDDVTQISGSLQETVEGIVNLRRITSLRQGPFKAFISLRVPISRQNYEDIGNVASAFIPYAIDRIIFSFDDSRLKMSKALPHIGDAINISILNRVWVLTQGIPLCAMTGLEHHVSEIYHRPDGDHKKSKKCKKCVYDEVCPGVRTHYSDHFGFSQLKPVLDSRHIEDIRRLNNEPG
jgi:MoaA/NifB/PqqE/SkfB family radical SAM enzyme